MIAVAWWGCTQPEDILTEKSTTLIHLYAERLPTTPQGMTYQLWVADTIIDDSIHGSIAVDEPFTYNFETNKYLDAAGLARPDSNQFRFNDDILKYNLLFMSVQRQDGSGPVVGPVMLLDTITPAWISEIDMVFPYSDSLWYSAVEFNMETPSDGDRTANDGAGIWFSVYSEKDWVIQDTTDLPENRIVIEYLTVDSFTTDEGPCVTSIEDIQNIRLVDTIRIFGFDTIDVQVIRFDQVTFTVCDSGQGNLQKTNVTLPYVVGPEREGRYDNFSQVAINLPDLRRFGWYYQGWVLSSVIEDMGVGLGEFTPPAYIGFNEHDSIIRGTEGQLLSTGLFYDLYEPDSGNPHVDISQRVPPYPGEDFLKQLPGQQDVAVNLVPGNGPTGSVFIAMHPVNAYTDTTNFPLIVQLRDLPSDTAEVQARNQQFTMRGMVYENSFGIGVGTGFPQVRAKIQRF